MKLTTDKRLVLLMVKGVSIDRVIQQIRMENPDAFHTAETLAQRVFVDEPARGEPCKGFVRPAGEREA